MTKRKTKTPIRFNTLRKPKNHTREETVNR